MSNLYGNVREDILLSAIGLLIHLHVLIHSHIAADEATSSHSDFGDVKGFPSRLIIEVLEVNFNAQFFQRSQLVTIAVVVVEFSSKHIAVKFAARRRKLA